MTEKDDILKDDTLEDLFRNFDPELNDDAVFMSQLNRRLEAIEYLKAVQDRQLRRYRYAIVAAFTLGIVCGSGLFYFLLQHPVHVGSLSFDTQLPLLATLAENSNLILLSLIALLISYAFIAVMNLLQEIWQQKPDNKMILTD